MQVIIEKLIEFITPDVCIGCGHEGSCLCQECSLACLVLKKPACVLCNALSDNGAVCSNCRRKTKLAGSTIAYRYDGVIKELIYAMKYEGRRSVIRYFSALLPSSVWPPGAIVCFVPSDGASRRQRGYDQAELLAKHYARLNGMECVGLLMRSKHSRQVGRSRQDRFTNVTNNFLAKGPIANVAVILVDDVVTTGATISECAKVLKNAGANSVWALAIAKK